MLAKFCSSCGREGASDKYYCTECGGFLVPKGRGAALGQSANRPSFTLQKSPRVIKKGGCAPSLMKLIKFFFLFFVISLGMFIGFAVLKPLTELPPPVQENAIASMLVPRAFLLAQNGNFSSLSQQVINSYLLIKGGPIVEFQMPNIHPLQWRSSSVVLTEGQISCHLELALFNHLIYCSELFRLSGTRTHWTLEPISGSIGRVPFSGEFLMLLTPLFEFYATPVKSELAQIANNGTVIIHPGILEFGLQ